jgi:hypothetical protein
LLISYDLECNASGPPDKPDEWVIPKAANSLGAAAFFWPERTLVPLPLAEATFHRSIVPVVARNEIASRFWRENPGPAAVIGRNPVSMDTAAVEFQKWLKQLEREFKRPLALIAGPHFFDSAQLADVMGSAKLLDWLSKNATMHDVRDSIAHHLGLKPNAAGKRYKRALESVKGFVVHIDDHDSVIQGIAFCAATKPV